MNKLRNFIHTYGNAYFFIEMCIRDRPSPGATVLIALLITTQLTTMMANSTTATADA